VRGAIGNLPGEQAKVIQLAYFGGFSHSEIAQILGLPMGTVKGRMRLGLEKIRGELAEGLA
jgi:RNA polymerase sigma-70 factor, ECF subfamily